MNRSTGKPLADAGHLEQRIGDILSTPIGSRVMRRDYGSQLPELVDQPMNAAGHLRLFAATALALLRWEPAARLVRAGVVAGAVAGTFVLSLDVEDLEAPIPATRTISIPLELLRPAASGDLLISPQEATRWSLDASDPANTGLLITLGLL